MNHDLKQIGLHTYQCIVCEVSWAYLTNRDIEMLTQRGKCIGQKEVWRKCKRYPSMRCLGIKHPECAQPPG